MEGVQPPGTCASVMDVPNTTDPLALDLTATATAICEGMRDTVRSLGRRGVVLGISGGIDSSCCAGLAVQAFGPAKVMLLRMPEKDVGTSSSDLGLTLAQHLEAPTLEENISEALEGLGCYRRRDEALVEVFPEYRPSWKHKVVRSAPGGIVTFKAVVQKDDGSFDERRIPAGAYRKLIAATNMKQRVRKLIEYTWADNLGYAVIGTPNKLEYDQGFFVKGGDGLADVKPIARLYKTQVYALAKHLGLPDVITSRSPTTETFSLPQSQEEFYYGYPHETMDLIAWGFDSGADAARVAPLAGLDADEIERAYDELRRVRAATAYLHAPAHLVDLDGSHAPAHR